MRARTSCRATWSRSARATTRRSTTSHTDHELARVREGERRPAPLRRRGRRRKPSERRGAGGARPSRRRPTGTVHRRRCLHVELHESKAVAELLNKLERKGLSVDQYRADRQAALRADRGRRRAAEEARADLSIPEILESVKDVGKRGVQITRFKGLGEMDAKELFTTTMDPIEAPPAARVGRRRRRSRGNVLPPDGRRSRAAPPVHRGQRAQRAQSGYLIRKSRELVPLRKSALKAGSCD